MMRIRYLLVEDNQDHADLIRRAFAQSTVPHLLGHVGTGEAAVAVLHPGDKSHPRPDVVLLDISLPGMDGFGVLRWIKADPTIRRTPVVMLTTSRASRDVAQAYDAGANGYVCKPDGFQDLCATVQALAEYWSRCNLNPY